MIRGRLFALFPQGKRYIVQQVLWQWASLFCQIMIVFTVADMIQGMVEVQVMSDRITVYLTAILLAIVCRHMADRQATHASYRTSADVKLILRERIYTKLLRLGSAYREQVSTAQVVQVASEGVEQLETYFGNYLPQLFYSLLAPMTLFVVLSFSSVKASVVLLVCVPLIPVSIVAVQKLAKKLLNKYWGIYTELGDSFLENLQGLTTLKIYRCDDQKAREMDEESQRFRRITMKVLTMQLNSTSVMDIIAYGGSAVGMLVAAAEYRSGSINLAETLRIVLLASEFFLPLRLLGSYFHIAMNGMAASDKIFDLLDLPETPDREIVLRDHVEQIVLDEVSFSYEAGQEILRNVSIHFTAGSLISLVGESGCGKSTIAALLMGRNRGYEGSITVDGRELSRIEEASLMQHLTLVSYNSYLFKGTVAENLRMAKDHATKEEMIRVLEKVNLWGYLDGQDGLETQILEKGSNLSGGQCQRLALARALLHDTPVYIFDEATSNIDVESEDQIMQVIHELAETKMVILISHRLANVVRSHMIYVLDAGKIVESGTHEELMEHRLTYYNLYRRQSELENYGKAVTA